MERPTDYGTRKFASCKKCSWTGPLESFERRAALIQEKIKIICPKCNGESEFKSNTFAKSSTRLPEEMTFISGGQTGVDRGALDAAIERGIPHRGWCPKGRKAEDGPIPPQYNMQEMDDWQYWRRTEKNVLDSDGTLVLPGKRASKGTELTIKVARRNKKPLAVVDIDNPNTPDIIRAWIKLHNIKIMNVAGPRESGEPGISKKTYELLLGL